MTSSLYRHSKFGSRGCFGDLTVLYGDFHQACVNPLLTSMDGAVRSLRRANFRGLRQLEEVHGQISAPTLLIWGQDDRFFPTGQAREMLPQFANPAGLYLIPGTRLLVHEEAPEAVLDYALPFLRNATGARHSSSPGTAGRLRRASFYPAYSVRFSKIQATRTSPSY